MHDRLFARLGEQAVLRGDTPCLVSIERGVTVTYEVGDPKFYQSEVASTVDVANLLSATAPKPGDSLSVGSANYVIDGIAADNGHMVRCILRGG